MNISSFLVQLQLQTLLGSTVGVIVSSTRIFGAVN